MTLPAKTPHEKLRTPVQFVKGVGPQRAPLLEKLGLKTAADVLFHFPRDYQDLTNLKSIAELAEGEEASICGVIEEVELRNTAPGRSVLGVLIKDDSDYLRAVWFNQPFMQQKLRRGERVLLSGVVRQSGLRWEIAHPRVETLQPDETPAGSILPIYPLTEGLSLAAMRRIAQQVVDEYAPLVEETFPEDFLPAHNLLPIGDALPQIHSPANFEQLSAARRRFIYQELLVLQLALALRKQALTSGARAPRLPTSGLIDARIRRLFPFALTGDQEQAIREITADMDRDWPMNRLLHGEVGSGKTAVAVYAVLVAVAHGHQAAIMAPTEVLAQQHWQTLSRMLRDSQVRMALLSGGVTPAQRRDTLEKIAAGEIDLVVGTHAVVQSDVQFARLGLVVIDEQHKFGVRQRATLRGAGNVEREATEEKRESHSQSTLLVPHSLVMTATPIPRTLALSLYGDLDVSTLRDVPPGRQTVNTYVVGANDDADGKRAKWWEFFRGKLRQGRQGYVIAPLVDDTGVGEAASVQAMYENLTNGELADFRLDVIHGRMSAAEKRAVMDAFGAGETQVLVATSVVEVGVDIPNATLMTIEDAQRFGLAQLHQLRGRVSRGTQPGFVCAFVSSDNSDALQRLAALARTSDGFELAEIDFQLRGPGDLLGTRQHGLPPLRIANLQRDAETLVECRRDAAALVAEQELWNGASYARLRQMVARRYGTVLELGDVG
jgi:ATP-dependent DNA helicase RecG